ncbi:MAG: TolC family protein [Cyanobacteria bacterium SZAS LIN-3]|nr:TolC family protein [Cyanobacteria bacterium SZAS LIN-3]
MKCIKRQGSAGLFTRAQSALQAIRALSTVLTMTLAAPAYADETASVPTGTLYKEQLHAYSDEARALAKAQPATIASPILINEKVDKSRQMPPLPTKSIKYSQLVDNKSIGEISIFQDDSLVMKSPKLSGLITIEQAMSPFSMDAKLSQTVTLNDLLRLCVTNNLDITLSCKNAKAAKYEHLSSLGRFLPDIVLGDQQYWLKGNIKLPGNSNLSKIKLNGPFMIGNAGFNYHVYQGGKVMFGALQSKHQLNAANAREHTTYSDALVDIARRYYQLALEESILQIRIRAADTSEEQVRVSTQRFENGLGTNLDVLQARQQLATDRQSLLNQQVARRQAAINLAAALNYDMAIDLKPALAVDRKVLLKRIQNVEDLVKTALLNRPELKDLIEQRRAAKSQIGIASSVLQPTVDFVGNVYGIGQNSSRRANLDALYFLGLNLNWKLGGLGTVDAANIAAAKTRASAANIELKKMVVTVIQSVRTAYITSLSTDQNIVESDNRVMSASEELRLAGIRYQTGVGTHLDVLTAQRDYTQAQIAKAQAITDFNLAQVQLVRELGLASVNNLTSDKPIL